MEMVICHNASARLCRRPFLVQLQGVTCSQFINSLPYDYDLDLPQ
jgi:hypothetical protein